MFRLSLRVRFAFGFCFGYRPDHVQRTLRDILELVAQDALRSHKDTDFYQGQLQAMRYFMSYELPKIDAWLEVVAQRNATCREMQDAWF